MSALAQTSLSADERRLLDAWLARLRETMGDDLRAVWLFGSRARGEPPAHEDSDVDLLVLVRDASWDARRPVGATLQQVADELGLGALPIWFTPHVHDVRWLEGRREIRSFFVQEVDRDKVVLYGAVA